MSSTVTTPTKKSEKGPTYDLYAQIYAYSNLDLAFRKTRKRKTLKDYVLAFEDNLQQNLLKLQQELVFHTYRPQPLKTFILRDPKTRKISKSAFRDRVIHHAICNIVEPFFDKTFIHDSYANRPGKGTLKAIQRFDFFKRQVSQNNTRICFVLKADLKHYFQTVSHNILFSIIERTIKDQRVLWLIKTILANHNTTEKGRGMPLGNLTSQFFANIYLNELDQYVKHDLKAKYYIRYVDDFVILSQSKEELEIYKEKINTFLTKKLELKLHPDKSKILLLKKGINFLGFRIFFHHKLVAKRNLKKFERKFKMLISTYKKGMISREKALEKVQGWIAYASKSNTYKYRKHITQLFNHHFPLAHSTKKTTVQKHEKTVQNLEIDNLEFSIQKTLHLLKKNATINEIAHQRNIKKTTVLAHIAKLIEYHQLSLWNVLPKKKIWKILPKIANEKDKLKDVKKRIKDDAITFDDINCVLASIKAKNRKKNICHLIKWYQKTHCYRKCYFYKKQRMICGKKFDDFLSKNPDLEMKRREFVELFNSHMNICVLPEKEKIKYITLKEFNDKIQHYKLVEV